MDRAVLNEANLRNANLQRTIFTRCACCGSFGAAIIAAQALLARLHLRLCAFLLLLGSTAALVIACSLRKWTDITSNACVVPISS